ELAELEADLCLAVLVAGLPEHVELGLPQLADHRIVAERRVQHARLLERLGALRLELPRLLPVPQRAIDAREMIVPQHRRAPVMARAPRRVLLLAGVSTRAVPRGVMW